MVLLIISAFAFSCDKYSREEFSFERENYSGEELKTNGFYYEKINSVQYEVFFLYRNGIVYGPHIHNEHSIEGLEERIMTSYSLQTNDGTPPDWGIFRVIGDEIIMEGWGQGSGGPYPVLKNNGTILDDERIQFSMSNLGSFEFNEYSVKPDSINRWIE